ncbi:site-specific DNA-methyltransferase [Kordiimonas sediminis]|uniref:site-specific DNA-methyltransferase (adenine-specific) n=1 Tax=Kordiimonas sediminis TaxID=1735581 RepID=A0A919E4B0_9PROT|nr:site-specific DNA-methyltransferase [Kordiimonas sediminis]GHF12473.1 site-specific DNA-methyltransferase [Kordiimonas sediminis]
MEKMKMHTPNLTDDNILKIKDLFPSVVTEARDEDGKIKLAVDFDQLRQELSDHIVEGPQERYHLNWPGKREALLTANAPIAKTLRPCREESVDFDTTKNLFIEGDNLEALKLLQETFLASIKMAYLDPPYNRKKGENLVYRDDFTGNSYEYFEQTNQISEAGEQLVANTESNGRFHSDWLNMLYPRLRIARNILSDEGVVLIAIDDSETSNVIQLCNEVFGENNFVGTLIWKNVTDNNPTNVAIEHESIHIYAKSKLQLENVWKSSVSAIKDALIEVGNTLSQQFPSQDELQAEYTKWFRENKSQLGPLDRYKYIDHGGVYTGSQSVHNPGSEGYRYDVLHPDTGMPCKEPLMGYRFPKETMDKLLASGKILFGSDENKIIELKVYAHEYKDKLSSVFELDGRTGPYDLKTLFPEAKKVFSNPKPVQLLKKLASFCTHDDAVCVDLFAGSSTLSQAVMELNAEQGSSRRFISIQYPEKIEPTTKDAKEALAFCESSGTKPYISEISKERIRRAGEKVRGSGHHKDWNKDVGFRVLKIDTSNMADVYYRPDEIKQGDLLATVSNIKEGRDNPEDLLFQVLLDWGVDLTLPIEKKSIRGKDVYFVDQNALVACFDTGVTEELVKEIAGHAPLRVVFKDNGFVSDSVKINVDQVFRQLSPSTEVKSI